MNAEKNTKARERYASDPEYRARILVNCKRWNTANLEKKRARSRRNHKELRLAVFEAYGGAKCVCCGETTYEFLSIDHINDDGATERRNGYAAGGASFYRRLQRDGFPPGYQVLCHNCNQAKGFYGVCPHAA